VTNSTKATNSTKTAADATPAPALSPLANPNKHSPSPSHISDPFTPTVSFSTVPSYSGTYWPTSAVSPAHPTIRPTRKEPHYPKTATPTISVAPSIGYHYSLQPSISSPKARPLPTSAASDQPSTAPSMNPTDHRVPTGSKNKTSGLPRSSPMPHAAPAQASDVPSGTPSMRPSPWQSINLPTKKPAIRHIPRR
jgi:hypothetical protein